MSVQGHRDLPPHHEFGVYIHVPFCAARCDYCAFATYTDRDHLMERYVHACRTEIHRVGETGELPLATSVFIGGGTPSRLPVDLVCALVEAVPRRPGAEVTVECNPEDADAATFAAWRGAGVSRVSFGVQSTVPHVLASLGRRHQASTTTRAAELVAAAGFASWNADLILGAASETDADWRRTLQEVLSWPTPPPHVSVYALTVEPGTPLHATPERHPDEETQARRYQYTDQVLTAAGYGWEEISNWAIPGHGCRHNRLYWRQGDYLGIGAAAHSHRQGRRWWNIRTPERYLAAVAAGRSAMAAEEHLSASERAFEALALSLRTPEGVPASVLPDPQEHPELVDLYTLEQGRAVLTTRGRLLANEVTTRLLVPGPRPEDRGVQASQDQPVSSPR